MRTLRPLAVLVGAAVVPLAVGVHSAGCQQAPVNAPVRSLQNSGRTSFLCLLPPGPAGSAEQPLSACTTEQFVDINAYLYEDDAGYFDAGAGALPHLYALVTQTKRGEVAVVDTSSLARSVIDDNPLEPGANFLPVGGQPTGLVSTPGSYASFVGTSELGQTGIFVLPSWRIRPRNTIPGYGGAGGTYGHYSVQVGVPELTSWPACALPAAPGDMILVDDPAIDSITQTPLAPGPPPGQCRLERPTCDSPYSVSVQCPDPSTDLLSNENQGRQKIVVSMPSLGGVLVLDAQTLYDLPDGSFDACPIERWVQFDPVPGSAIGALPPAPPPSDTTCVNPPLLTSLPQASYTPRPAGLSYANGTLYVADTAAPVIHVLDMQTPCEPVERAPLLPVSAADPQQLTFTSRVSAAPTPTPDLKQYVYATDTHDGSVMVFDVGPSSTTRLPLVRKNAALNPFQPIDRVQFSAPVADILVVQHDSPATNPITGIAQAGVRCDPNPNLLSCTAAPSTTSCDVATLYQTDTSTYQTGAGPYNLRGEFTFAALTSGKLAVIDVDDFDAACRGPAALSSLEGCGKDRAGQYNTALEMSCNVVEPNAPRSANYEVANSSAIGSHVPGIDSFPLLYDLTGSNIAFNSGTSTSSPTMVAPAPTDAMLPVDPIVGGAAGYSLFVGGCQVPLGTNPSVGNTAVVCTASTQGQHVLLMNLEDPRAAITDEDWTVTFEGPIPGFGSRLADFRAAVACEQDSDCGCTIAETCDGGPSAGKCVQHQCAPDSSSPAGVYDLGSRFCDLGVESEGMVKDLGLAALVPQVKPPLTQLTPALLADYVQIVTDPPVAEDGYWQRTYQCKYTTDGGGPNSTVSTASYAICLQDFGTFDAPTTNRDMRIVEAYQDHVELTRRPLPGQDPADPKLADLSELKCCFPGSISFQVRTGNQWTVAGDQTGFVHRVVADPATGRCRNSCDPTLVRKNSRVLELPAGATPTDADPLVFRNPMYRFAILSGSTLSQRDYQFRFTTTGSFSPILATLSSDATALVQPQALTYLLPTNELVVTDGLFNGIIFVSLQTMTFTRSFF